MLQQWAPGHGVYPVTPSPHQASAYSSQRIIQLILELNIFGKLSESIKTYVEKVYYFPHGRWLADLTHLVLAMVSMTWSAVTMPSVAGDTSPYSRSRICK